MECFADRIRFFFFFYVLWLFRAIFFSLLFRPEEKGRMQSDFKVLRMSPFDITLFEYSTFHSFVFLSSFLFICGSSFNHSHIFRVSHHVATCVASFVFSSPWVNPIYPSGLFLSLSLFCFHLLVICCRRMSQLMTFDSIDSLANRNGQKNAVSQHSVQRRRLMASV